MAKAKTTISTAQKKKNEKEWKAMMDEWFVPKLNIIEPSKSN
jgi:hypothetical protein